MIAVFILWLASPAAAQSTPADHDLVRCAHIVTIESLTLDRQVQELLIAFAKLVPRKDRQEHREAKSAIRRFEDKIDLLDHRIRIELLALNELEANIHLEAPEVDLTPLNANRCFTMLYNIQV